MTKALDKQVGGKHYQKFAIQPLEFISKNDLSFSVGNVVKYVCRHKFKNGAEDIQKAIHYCLVILEFEYGIVQEGENPDLIAEKEASAALRVSLRDAHDKLATLQQEYETAQHNINQLLLENAQLLDEQPVDYPPIGTSNEDYKS